MGGSYSYVSYYGYHGIERNIIECSISILKKEIVHTGMGIIMWVFSVQVLNAMVREKVTRIINK